ncbi:MAG: T9SS type A sorting domain-containing protein [Bacteroidota bacterium]
MIKPVHFGTTSRIRIFTIIMFSLYMANPCIQAQEPWEEDEYGYSEYIDPNPEALKSAEGTEANWWAVNSYNGSYYSDYYVHFRWSGLYGLCDCDNKLHFSFRLGGKEEKTYATTKFTYTNYGVRFAWGASKSGSWTYYAPNSGTEDLVFSCVATCSGAYWQSTGSIIASTASIRSPTNVSASDNTSDQSIKITWDKRTDIPNAHHGYKIYRNGEEIESVYNGIFSYIDTGLNPGESYTYTVHTYTTSWGGHTSSGVSDTGSTFDLGLEGSDNEAGKVILTWNDVTDPVTIWGENESTVVQKFKIDRVDDNTAPITLSDNIDKTTTNYRDESNDLIPGYSYTYILTPFNLGNFEPDTALGKMLPNGKIKGKIIAPSGFDTGIPNVEVCAVRLDSVPQDTTTTYCTVTDPDGYFEISNIYYYENAKFRITPRKGTHDFEPAYSERILDLDIPSVGSLNFTDISAFTISGKVTQTFGGVVCNVPEVEILLNGVSETTTNSEGEFTVSVDLIGEYTFTPVLEGHYFDPPEHTFYIDTDTIQALFDDTTRFILDGYLRASCDYFIGQADLKISADDLPVSCFDTLITTEAGTGYFALELPARNYKIELINFYPDDSNLVESSDVMEYFTTEAVDLTKGDVRKNMIYRSVPTIQVTGFDRIGCGNIYDGVPIVTQGEYYDILFEVQESFGESTCPADTGYIIIYNKLLSDKNRADTLVLNNGQAVYTLVPEDVNIISPYLNKFEATAFVGDEEVIYSQDVLVEGNRPREQTFTTVSPEIPFMILRDPPGDASYSYLENNTVTNTSFRFQALAGGSLKLWREVKAGVKFESGMGVTFETEIWGKLKGSLEVGASIRGQSEFGLTITNGERFETSNNQDITGEEGDLFIGSALNMIYALTDIITYDPDACNVSNKVDLSMGADGFATTFIYTEDHIRNVLVPQLTYLGDLYSAAGNDSSKIYNDQVKVWLQTLKTNQEIKRDAEFIENRSFSANASYEGYNEVTTTESRVLEFNMYVETQVAAEAGLEVGGIGASGGVEATFRLEYGESSSESVTSSRKTGYYLSDDDAGDVFSVDILADEVYGTPVFQLVSGSSSCPWEPGTQPREGVQVISDVYNIFVGDPDGEGVFTLQLGNTSQSDEDFTYFLSFDQASNPDGAEISIGGSPVQGPVQYFVPEGEFREATVTVKRGPSAFDYNNLQFIFASGCDPLIADTVLLNVHFSSPCSPITLTRPGDNWVLTGSDNNRLKIRLEDYDKALMEFIKIQVSLQGRNTWNTVMTIDRDNLDDSMSDITVLFNDVADGNYDMRIVLECSEGKVYSDVFNGIIDRTPPELFGLLEPSDQVLDEGDVIMATFTENLDCFALSEEMINLTDVTTGEAIDFSLGCNGNSLAIIPEVSGIAYDNDTFSVVVEGIADQFGNVSSESIEWNFVVNGNIASQTTGVTETETPYQLYDNYPNPFIDQTTIRYYLPYHSHVILKVFDNLGREITTLVDQELPQGDYEVTWKSKEYSSGIYFYSIYSISMNSNDQFWKTRKMVHSNK